jgi:cytoskeleton protein RodZ
MSEGVMSASEDRGPVQDSAAQASAGAMLREAREAQGLHIATLAVSLKVPVKKLEALEADRYDLLLDIVFVRALAASVCRALKIDPNPILDSLPATAVPSLKTDEAGINTPFHLSGERSGLSVWDQLSRPLVLAVLVLLVGVLVLVFFPFDQLLNQSSEPKSGTAVVTSPLSTPTPARAPEAVAGASAPVSLSSLVLSSSDASLAMSPATAASSVAVSPPPAASAAAPANVPGSGAATGIVVFKAHGSSWLEVVDANGIVQVRKTLSNGEVVGVSGVLPLSAVVGRSAAMEVEVRGKPFDLARHAKDNVARFEVK